MSRDHIAVIRNPEPGAKSWMMAMGSGDPIQWKFTPSGGSKPVWAKEAIQIAVAQDLSVDVTISTMPPKAVLADPDSIADGYNLTLICSEGLSSSRRWAILAMDKNGNFRINGIERGRSAELLLERIAAATKDEMLDRSVFWVRPGMRAVDFVTREQLFSHARYAA